MAAIIGAAADVPPTPTQPLGAPLQALPPLLVSEAQMVRACPQTPLAANRETSGTSRTPSAGLPKMPACQLGLDQPVHVVSSTYPYVEFPAPLAQLLGPPLPAAVLRNCCPVVLLQNADGDA